MNVQLENLPKCITTMRVEVPSEKVSEVWNKTVLEYLQHARVPGYRPGKAPRAVVERKFGKDIKEQVQKEVLTETCRNAITENKLRVLTLSDVQDVELGADKSLKYTATLITAPAFELPEYKGLAVTLAPEEVTDAEFDEALEALRDRSADFNDVTGRPVQMEDFVVIDYAGTLDGVALGEAVEGGVAKPLAGNTDFWVKMTPESFLPGFCEALLGAAPGEAREFDVEVPADFPVSQLIGRKLHYSVTVKEVKEKILPELNDDFAAKLVPGKTLEQVKEFIRADLHQRRRHENEGEKRNQIVKQLVASVECELPERYLQNEVSRVLNEIVRENQSRGVPDEVIQSGADELIASARESAHERLKGTFILLRIAEVEKITVAKQEFESSLAHLADRVQMTVEKLRKQMNDADTLDRFHEEILTGKVLDFLASNVSVSTSAPEEAKEA